MFNQDNPNAVAGPGPSGSRQGLAPPNLNLLNAELALSQIGNFEPLDFKIDTQAVDAVISSKYADQWVDYLPRTDRPNNRRAMSLTTIPGWNHRSLPSIPEAMKYLGREVKEFEFNQPTELYTDLNTAYPGLISVKDFLDQFQPLGRTFIVNSGIGGYFVPHRDHPGMPRPCFRLVCFLKNCGPLDYDWWMDDRKANIELGRVYYVNTRMTHRTISWVNDSWHMILNVPFTVANVNRVLEHLQHRH
jgi:hypothetical protein